ncbi:LysR family transcriptional regulator [Streptomyces sp. NPDC054796]
MATLQQFRTLRSVQVHGGIHAAAKELHLSPSAVSQQIKALASECGFSLLEPDGRGVRLTDSGSELAQIGSQISELWERSVSRRQRDPGPVRGARRPVRLGAFPSAMASSVLPALDQPERLGFGVELFETTPYEGRDLVEEGTLDAALSIQEVTRDDSAPCQVAPLWHDPFVLVGPRGLLSSVLRSDSPRALSATPWVLPRVGSDCDRLLSNHFARHGIRAHAVGRTDDWLLAQRMATVLRAVAYVPSSALLQDSELSRAVDMGSVNAPARTVALVAPPAAAATTWFPVLQRHLKRAHTRTTGMAYST